MAATFELPHHVMSILRAMQQFKDALQWNVEMTSQRVVLQLKWTLHSQQRSDVIARLLERVPATNQRHSWRRRFARHCSNVRRALTRHNEHTTSHWLQTGQADDSRGRRAWTDQIPRKARTASHSDRSPQTQQHPTLSATQADAAGSSRHSHVTDVTQSTLPLPLWQRCQSLGTLTSADADTVTSPSGAGRTRPQLTYRSQASLQDSLEEMFERWRDATQQQLRRIKREWDDDVTRWPYATLDSDRCSHMRSDYTASRSRRCLEQIRNCPIEASACCCLHDCTASLRSVLPWRH